MASSRTGTITWKKAAALAKRLARAQGQTHCPFCRVELDYDVTRQPNSAEPDHIIPHARGGRDHVDNLRIICRRCNQSKGDHVAPRGYKPPPRPLPPLVTSREW